MAHEKVKQKVEFGDYQTPDELAFAVCEMLVGRGLRPRTIVEPTCGTGSFIKASALLFPEAERIIGVDINLSHLLQTKAHATSAKNSERIHLVHDDFFKLDWRNMFEGLTPPILVIGNFPWVTNAALASIGGANLPIKSNFQKHRGVDAITGKSNFDISEWMTIQVVDWLRGRRGAFALLLKTTVARKILQHIHKAHADISYSAIFKIDAEKAFGASIDACLLFCDFTGDLKGDGCDVFESISAAKPTKEIGFKDGVLLNNVRAFEESQSLALSTAGSGMKWRSGIKHDCSKVMELEDRDGGLYNRFGERVDIEEDYVFPLFKGSDVANGRTDKPRRHMIVTQRFVGEATLPIKDIAPKTWTYLKKHQALLDNRKSRIYKNKPSFSIFGVGEYSFSNWKVAICSLYKRLHFESVGPVQGRPVVFDDTVYFVPCRNKREARAICDLLSSEESVKFLSAHIFWDSKRPITTSVLNRVNIESLAEMLGRSDEIRGRHDSLPTAQDGLPSFLKPPTHSAQLAVKKET